MVVCAEDDSYIITVETLEEIEKVIGAAKNISKYLFSVLKKVAS